MTPPAVGLGTLRRLSEMPTEGHPVLSLYLNLDRAARSRPATCVGKLDALVAHSTPRPSLRDGETARDLLCGLPPLPHGARSLALFSCAEAGCSAVVPLPDAVEAMAALEPVPWLEPLAGLFAPGGWGVAVLDRSRTRLLRGGPRMLVEFAALAHELPAAHTRCGFSLLAARRSTRRIVLEHAGRLSSMLLRAHRRRPFERLVLTAPPEMCHLLEGALDGELRARLHRSPRREIDPEDRSVTTAIRVTSPEASWQS
jgi:release factor family 10